MSNVSQPGQYVLAPAGSRTLPVYTKCRPLRNAISRQRVSVLRGVLGVSIIFQLGWKAVRCRGTSAPRLSAIQRVMASISASESFSPGISSVVSSSQAFVSALRYFSVSSTGSRWPPQIFQ